MAMKWTGVGYLMPCSVVSRALVAFIGHNATGYDRCCIARYVLWDVPSVALVGAGEGAVFDGCDVVVQCVGDGCAYLCEVA